MKKIIIVAVFFTFFAMEALAQSNSYRTIKNKFNNSPDVHSFSVGGWACRLIFSIAGEYEFKKAVEDVEHIRLITIPKSEFEAKEVTIKGLKRLLMQDSYQQLAHIRDNGEDVTIYLRESGNKKNYYFVLVEEEREVVAIELKGYINPDALKDKKLAFNN
jgi:Domain of unknown function (DUF4252)